MGLIVSAAFAILLLITLRVVESISTVRPPMDMFEASWMKPHGGATMFLVISYDVPNDTRRATIAKALENVGRRVQ